MPADRAADRGLGVSASGRQGPGRAPYALAALGVFAADQLCKAWAVGRLQQVEPIEVVPGWFRLVLVRNRGALFGMFQDLSPSLRPLLFLALPGLVIAALGWLAWRSPAAHRRARWAFTLLVGGALGNLSDRLRFGHVIDFLDFYIVGAGGRSHHWPAFNLADSCICVGIALLAFDSWSARHAQRGGEERAPDPD